MPEVTGPVLRRDRGSAAGERRDRVDGGRYAVLTFTFGVGQDPLADQPDLKGFAHRQQIWRHLLLPDIQVVNPSLTIDRWVGRRDDAAGLRGSVINSRISSNLT